MATKSPMAKAAGNIHTSSGAFLVFQARPSLTLTFLECERWLKCIRMRHP